MKANTVGNLQDILDTDLVWRRKEISTLISIAKTSEFAAQTYLVRACVPLLYAHWEGFSKQCFTRYLEFVSYRRLKYKSLNPSFLFIASSPSLNKIKTSGVRDGLSIVRDFLDKTEDVNKENFRKRVDTKSNLRSEVICDLLALCGLPFNEFSDEHTFIDKELCDPRNEVAHGVGGGPSLNALIERRDKAFGIMTRLQTIVVNAAIGSQYRVAA